MLVPDAPINLANNPSVTSALQIGLTWTQGLSNNGKPVIDYTISFDQAIGVWLTIATGVV